MTTMVNSPRHTVVLWLRNSESDSDENETDIVYCSMTLIQELQLLNRFKRLACSGMLVM